MDRLRNKLFGDSSKVLIVGHVTSDELTVLKKFTDRLGDKVKFVESTLEKKEIFALSEWVDEGKTAPVLFLFEDSIKLVQTMCNLHVGTYIVYRKTPAWDIMHTIYGMGMMGKIFIFDTILDALSRITDKNYNPSAGTWNPDGTVTEDVCCGDNNAVQL